MEVNKAAIHIKLPRTCTVKREDSVSNSWRQSSSGNCSIWTWINKHHDQIPVDVSHVFNSNVATNCVKVSNPHLKKWHQSQQIRLMKWSRLSSGGQQIESASINLFSVFSTYLYLSLGTKKLISTSDLENFTNTPRDNLANLYLPGSRYKKVFFPNICSSHVCET